MDCYHNDSRMYSMVELWDFNSLLKIKWRKIRFETFKDGNYNANSDGTIEGGVLENVDFRISTKNNSPLYIKSVRAINPGQQG